MEEIRRARSWRRPMAAVLLLAVVSLSFGGEAVAADDGAQPPLDTNVLCVSKCGTCPTVCSAQPPPPPSSSSSSGDPVLSPPKGTGGSGSSNGGGSSSSPSGQGAKGGRPTSSNYYYFFTAGGSRSFPATIALLLLPLLSLVAVFSQ